MSPNRRPCVPTLVLALAALLPASAAHASETVTTEKLGKKIEHLALKDAGGKPWSLADLKEPKAVVVVFLSFECPVSTSYAQLLAELAKTYGERGVAFVGVTTNPDEDTAAVARQAREYHLPFPVLKDEGFADLIKPD